MKILNKKKTHFMQPGKDGHRNVEFGTVSEVQAVINSILDAKQDKESSNKTTSNQTTSNQISSYLRALETEQSEKLNH